MLETSEIIEKDEKNHDNITKMLNDKFGKIIKKGKHSMIKGSCSDICLNTHKNDQKYVKL